MVSIFGLPTKLRPSFRAIENRHGSARRPQALLFALFVSRRPYSHLGIHTYARCRGGEETRIVRCETLTL